MTTNEEKQYKIILEYIKDLSIETPSASTLLSVRKNINNYQMDIDISSLLLKNKSLEITTKLVLQDKTSEGETAFFEIKYATAISIDPSITDKKIISKIVLCDLQKTIYPKIEKIFLNLIKDAGYPNIKFEKKVDFEKMYNDKFN
tara:strand:- start:1519 stop:1953 length:435 start_codon:yes stop_codon:yes gene_type:complete